MSRRVLVTGGTGFVGKRLCEALRQDGVEVRTLSRHDADFESDLADEAAVRRIVADYAPSEVFHLAALPSGSRDPDLVSRMYRTHVAGTFALTRALADRQPRLIAAGTLAEYGRAEAPYTEDTLPQPVSPYGSTKLMATELCRLYATTTLAPTAVLRACDLYGPGRAGGYFLPSLVAALRAGEAFEMSPGEQRRDYLFVDDFVDALIRAADAPLRGFRIANVGTGQPVALRELAETAARLLGKSEMLRVGARPYRAGEQMLMYGSVAVAREWLGWSAHHTLEDGLRRTVM